MSAVEGRARRSPTLVLTALVLVGSALSLWLALTRPDPALADPGAPSGAGESYRAADLEGPGGAALRAAVEVLPTALGYDYRDLGGGRDAATAQMTAGFAREFRATFRRSVVPTARDQSAITDVVVLGAGLVGVDGGRALCLLFVDQRLVESTSTDRGSAPVTVATSRVQVELRLRDGVWKVSDITPV